MLYKIRFPNYNKTTIAVKSLYTKITALDWT